MPGQNGTLSDTNFSLRNVPQIGGGRLTGNGQLGGRGRALQPTPRKESVPEIPPLRIPSGREFLATLGIDPDRRPASAREAIQIRNAYFTFVNRLKVERRLQIRDRFARESSRKRLSIQERELQRRIRADERRVQAEASKRDKEVLKFDARSRSPDHNPFQENVKISKMLAIAIREFEDLDSPATPEMKRRLAQQIAGMLHAIAQNNQRMGFPFSINPDRATDRLGLPFKPEVPGPLTTVPGGPRRPPGGTRLTQGQGGTIRTFPTGQRPTGSPRLTQVPGGPRRPPGGTRLTQGQGGTIGTFPTGPQRSTQQQASPGRRALLKAGTRLPDGTTLNVDTVFQFDGQRWVEVR